MTVVAFAVAPSLAQVACICMPRLRPTYLHHRLWFILVNRLAVYPVRSTATKQEWLQSECSRGVLQGGPSACHPRCLPAPRSLRY